MKVLVVRSVYRGVQDVLLLSIRVLFAPGDYLCCVKLHTHELWASS